MFDWLRARNEWKFAGVLRLADRGLALSWWALVALRGLLPAVFAIAMGWLVGAIEQGGDTVPPLVLVGVVFVTVAGLIADSSRRRRQSWQPDGGVALRPAHDGMYRAAGHGASREPHAHQRSDDGPRLRSRASVGRRSSSRWISSPAGWWRLLGGLASAAVLAGYAWWAPILLVGAWLATHWLLRESAVWRDRNTEQVRAAQRHADYAYRLAVDRAGRQGAATFWTGRLGRRALPVAAAAAGGSSLAGDAAARAPVIWSLLLVLAANIVVFWSLGSGRSRGQSGARPARDIRERPR